MCEVSDSGALVFLTGVSMFFSNLVYTMWILVFSLHLWMVGSQYRCGAWKWTFIYTICCEKTINLQPALVSDWQTVLATSVVKVIRQDVLCLKSLYTLRLVQWCILSGCNLWMAYIVLWSFTGTSLTTVPTTSTGEICRRNDVCLELYIFFILLYWTIIKTVKVFPWCLNIFQFFFEKVSKFVYK